VVIAEERLYQIWTRAFRLLLVLEVPAVWNQTMLPGPFETIVDDFVAVDATFDATAGLRRTWMTAKKADP